ncbi:alpha/beta hydrolase [Kibdelosporangium philippinense]|uniref:Alpha/beta hydrolase n=1 Tax=Kibdelosporangium philippinense TaxID=211113 RepID=A0ABS8Z623_9PSEU|nr:alpha/beta hydrolase [Kibdelosporangium philippinense]MCE7003331.1 alpha/beta hydrolase [Kibdelosporangium philippinense]
MQPRDQEPGAGDRQLLRPLTHYEFSQRMARQLGNAVLLSVDAFGHCILGQSQCVDKAAARYLTTLEVPQPGQVCQPNLQPF